MAKTRNHNIFSCSSRIPLMLITYFDIQLEATRAAVHGDLTTSPDSVMEEACLTRSGNEKLICGHWLQLGTKVLILDHSTSDMDRDDTSAGPERAIKQRKVIGVQIALAK